MRFLSRAALAAASLVVFQVAFQACSSDSPTSLELSAGGDPSGSAPGQGIQSQVGIYSANPRYHTYNGVPRVLLGGGATVTPGDSAEVNNAVNQGGNYARLWHNFTIQPTAWKLLASGKYDLTQWNETYWRQLRDIVTYAKSKQLVLSVMVFSEPGLETGSGRWAIHPFNPNNNVNGLGLPSGEAVPEFYNLSNAALKAIQEAYVTRLINEVAVQGNVIVELVNEYTGPSTWEAHFIQFVNARTSAPIAVNRLANPATALTLTNVDQANYHNLQAGTVFNTFKANYGKAKAQHYDEQALGTQTVANLQAMAWEAILGGGGINWDQSGNPSVTPGISLGVKTFLSSHAFQPWNSVPTTLAAPYAAMRRATDELVVYVSGSSVTVDLTGWSGTYDVKWYNPAQRTTVTKPTVSGGASRSFTPPAARQVLHLKRTGGTGSTGTIDGRILNDLNGNGRIDSGEPYVRTPASCSTGFALSGVSVSWTGPQAGSAAPRLCNPEPYYSSGQVATGNYTVQIAVPSGWTVTNPQQQSASVTANATVQIWFAIHQTTTALTGTLIGHIVKDVNGNGRNDPGEPFISVPGSCTAGVAVSGFAVSWTGPAAGSVTPHFCNPQGYYTSGPIATGAYTVKLVKPSGWVVTGIKTAAGWQATSASQLTVTIGVNSNANVWFAVR
jgi:hypothetical protein